MAQQSVAEQEKAVSAEEEPSRNRRFPIESLLSARHLFAPQLVGDYIYFLSNMSGVISLYRMRSSGSFPEPLLPGGLALQNPHLIVGESYVVFPSIGKILVMIDSNGDENYQPSFIPLEGGIPEPIFGEKYRGEQIACVNYDRDAAIAYFTRDDRRTPHHECIKVDLRRKEETTLGKSIYGNFCAGTSKDHSIVALVDGYTAADNVVFLWRRNNKKGERELFYGTPLESREKGKEYPPSGIGTCNFTEDGRGILVRTSLFDDSGSLGYLSLKEENPEMIPVVINGLKHGGSGELEDVRHVEGKKSYLLYYNIDGASWVYEGRFINAGKKPRFIVDSVIVGKREPLANGVVLGLHEALPEGKRKSKGYALSFTSATHPSQIYVVSGTAKQSVQCLSTEKVIGIPEKFLSQGEDASYTSFDGERISARIYLPSKALGFSPPYPLVLYVHGGPQGQERPDFTWFSMPLIQYLTLNGIAVFVPNVRGSTGYGQRFMKMVDHDWGGNDRLDLVEGLKQIEAKDKRIDSTRRGVIGRSYGGYMTLTLASRHPHLWKAAVDMFGPYNLTTFMERLPETWRTYFYIAVGHPEKDRAFLEERSPSTYIDNVTCSMLMIQGRNDPRVVERETRDVVERLRSRGVSVDYLVFEDEGHDVIKFKNRVLCYNKITDFFLKQFEKAS